MNVKTWPADEKGICQTQVEGLDNHNIWAIRAHKNGLQFQQAGSKPSVVTSDMALEFALSIIEVVRTQGRLYGWPVG